jgi:hypothetical protein
MKVGGKVNRSPIIDATAMLKCVLSAYVVLVRIAVHQRSVERAYALLEQLETLGCRQGLYFVTVGDHPAVVRDYCEARTFRFALYLCNDRMSFYRFHHNVCIPRPFLLCPYPYILSNRRSFYRYILSRSPLDFSLPIIFRPIDSEG